MAPGQFSAAVRGARRSLKAAGRTLAAAQAAGGAQPAPPSSTAIYQRLVNGKRFKCTQCGVCCTGAGDVWVNQADCQRLAAHLSIPEQDFVRLFTEKEHRSGWWTLRSVGEAQDCIFLGKDKACWVHGAKPLQCTTYPWWCAAWQHTAVLRGMAGRPLRRERCRPELMDDSGWRSEREGICEGMDHDEASACDAVEAGRQLQLATGHFVARDAAPQAAPRGRRRSN